MAKIRGIEGSIDVDKSYLHGLVNVNEVHMTPDQAEDLITHLQNLVYEIRTNNE